MAKSGRQCDVAQPNIDYHRKSEFTEKISQCQLHAEERYPDLTADDLYVNSKVAYGFNYVDSSLYITHDQDSQGEHGTHVSGIAAANAYVKASVTDDEGDPIYLDSVNNVGVVGVAPDAQIMTMKVFGIKGGAWDDDYVAAIEDAILLGADAINLSLGSSSAGFTTSNTDWIQGVFDGLDRTSSIVSISAGNSYSWGQYTYYGYNLTQDVNTDTVGSPGSYTNALTAASVGKTGSVSTSKNFTVAGVSSSISYTETVYRNNLFGLLDLNEGAGTEYDYVMLGTGVAGQPEDYAGIDVKGKIVMVQRSNDLTFVEKAENAAAAGAVATVIYNNATGTLSMDLSDYTLSNPVVSISQSNANTIRNASEVNTTAAGVAYYTGTMTVKTGISINRSSDPRSGTISSFSSWGTPGNLSIKPEITAPGGSIWSTGDSGSSIYESMSGTSMAAPSVTGMSALVMQYVKSNDTLMEIIKADENLTVRTVAQSLQMSAASPMVDGNSTDGSYYSVRVQGAGLADVSAAVDSASYIMVEGQTDGKVKAELGDDPERTGEYSFSFTVTNFSGQTVTYALDSSVMAPAVRTSGGNAEMSRSDIALDAAVTFDCGSTLTLESGKSAVVTATIKVAEDGKEWIEQNYENGTYVEGYIFLNGVAEGENAAPCDLSIPFLAFYGNWADASMYDINEYIDYYYANANGESVSRNYLNSVVGYDTNYFELTSGGLTYHYLSNPVLTDDAYLSDRNAINSENGDTISKVYITLVRNAADITFTVTDNATGVQWYEVNTPNVRNF